MDSSLQPAADGWVEWTSELPARVLVRFRRGDDDRFEVSDLHLDAGNSRVSSDLLRSIPISRIEAAANATGVENPDPETSTVGPVGVVTGSGGIRQRSFVGANRLTTRPPRPRPGSLRLDDPGGGKRPDGFYEDVASLYTYLSQHSRRPAADLAEANEVPVSTTHRWVKEARRRGLLAPGRPGRAG